MFKIIKPIAGYGYLVGQETQHIRPEDADRFIKYGLIEKVAVVEKKAPEQAKKSKARKA